MRKIGNLSLREAIVEIVAANSPVSTKKIHKKIDEGTKNNVSYQAVHKCLKKLAEQKKLIKQEGEFYLSSKTIDHFLSTVREIKNNQHIYNKNINYLSSTLKYKPVRIVPFLLEEANLHREEIKIITQDERMDIFEFDNTLYAYFKNTGVCIQLLEEKIQNHNVLEILKIRRKIHITTLQGESTSSKKIMNLASYLGKNPKKVQESLHYVMAVYFIEEDDNLKEIEENLLKILANTSITGITDNPEDKLDSHFLQKAKKMLHNFDEGSLSNNPFECVTLGTTDKAVICWSNVVSYGKIENNILSNKVIKLEVMLQYLWYSFYLLCRRKHLAQTLNSSTNIEQYIDLWNVFGQTDPTSDMQSVLLKEALIKTSKITDLATNFMRIYQNGK